MDPGRDGPAGGLCGSEGQQRAGSARDVGLPGTVIKVGDSVEGYRVISEIGRGAASAIYLVQDPSSKQIWALKQVIKHTDKDERFLEQTESEYAIASKLDHRNIRKVHKLIKKRPGLLRKPDELLMLMELADGQPLEKLPPRTFEMAAKIFEQVARALAYMHSRGFVHADMKPNNIIADADGFAKVIDLGQSCAVNTIKKRIQGTPDYIAPEQVHRKPITEKTDVYNLGATMYWTLTRRNVPTALGSDESLLGHIDESMMAKPKRPREYNSRVPESFDRLIMDCVEIEPSDRPANMAEVAERLHQIVLELEGEAALRRQGSQRQSSGSRTGMSPPSEMDDDEDD